MSLTRWLVMIAATGLLTALFAWWFGASPARSQVCISVTSDQGWARSVGYEWLGLRPLPFTDVQGVFYRAPDDRVLMSRVLPGGCVEDRTWTSGNYVPEVRV